MYVCLAGVKSGLLNGNYNKRPLTSEITSFAGGEPISPNNC